MEKKKITLFWFRRDLRLKDNKALFYALERGLPVLPVFIFDENILEELPQNDSRVSFIYDCLKKIEFHLQKYGSSIYTLKGNPLDIFKKLTSSFSIDAVYTNKDYEPYAIKRDLEIAEFLKTKEIKFFSYKDQVIFEENEILKPDNKPYTIFTHYKNKWLSVFQNTLLKNYNFSKKQNNFLQINEPLKSLESFGFKCGTQKVKDFNIENIVNYEEQRNIPSVEGTSNLSPHLRFGTVSIREIIKKTSWNTVFLSELIWREFFMQILFHFPWVIESNFKSKYNNIVWRNNKEEFELWCEGKTGYPLVDAGMRQLNQTGYMHNRVRMITAGFLCKHLLIDWRLGEAYFAEKLLDYELSSNNGNWQWSAGTGCDAAPYFRVFNPTEQLKKFDAKYAYIKKWLLEFDTLEYPLPIVEHKFARNRAIEIYKQALTGLK